MIRDKIQFIKNINNNELKKNLCPKLNRRYPFGSNEIGKEILLFRKKIKWEVDDKALNEFFHFMFALKHRNSIKKLYLMIN